MRNGPNSDTDSDVNTCGEVELLQLIQSACSWIDDVEEALVGPDFELLHRLLVDVNRTVNRELLDASWKWNRASNAGAGALCGFHDFLGGAVDRAVIEGAQTDANFLIFHSGGCLTVYVVGLQGE